MTPAPKSKLRILAASGAGFPGSHLCERLLAEDNEVICLDCFFDRAKRELRSSFE